MTFLELCKRLRQETGYQGTGPVTVVGQQGDLKRIVEWVNQAYLDIQNKWQDWRWLWTEGQQATTADVADYAPPADLAVYSEDTLRIGDESLCYVTFQHYRRDRERYDEMTPGRPWSFTILPNRSLRLFPTPDAAYNVDYEYFRAPVPLVENADEPLMPARYHEVIIHRARVYWAAFENAPSELQVADALFSEAMTRLEASELISQEMPHGRTTGIDIVVRPV